MTGVIRFKCPRLDCPPACKFPIRIITTPYRFIPWPLWPMLKHWRPDNLARGHLSLLHVHRHHLKWWPHQRHTTPLVVNSAQYKLQPHVDLNIFYNVILSVMPHIMSSYLCRFIHFIYENQRWWWVVKCQLIGHRYHTNSHFVAAVCCIH